MTTTTHQATLHTNQGDITLNLFGELAPQTVENFVGLATGQRQWRDPSGQPSNAPLYNGTVFHRVIDGFMIQGGDPLGNGTGGPGYTFDDECSPQASFDRPYLLAMANAGKGPDGSGTNGSQFFITVTPTPHLNGKHTIFGEVVDPDSRAAVDRIAKTQTGQMDRPTNDIIITDVVISPAS